MSCIKSDTTYALINAKAGTCMDLSGGDNYSIIGYGYHAGPNQLWIFESASGNHMFYVKSSGSGQYLAAAGDLQDGQKVVASEEPYVWQVVDEPKVKNGVRLFPEGITDFCADLSDYGNATPGTPVELWGRWAGENQVWKLQKP